MDSSPDDLLPNAGIQVDLSNRVPQIFIGVIIPFVSATIFVAGRLYARAAIVRAWGPDDTFVAISWILALGVTIAACVSTRYGSGHHQDAISPNSAIPALQLEYANLLMYQAALASTKFSICLFYLRLFSDRKTRLLTIGTMIWILCYFMPCEMIAIFQCSPVSGIWNKKISSKCITYTPCFYTSVVCNIVGDTWLILLIAPRIWPLKMPRKQKIALMSVITSGWLVIVAAILRSIRLSSSMGNEDRSWIYYDTAIWSGLEIAVGLFCVSAPAIKPVLQKYIPSLVASFSASKSYSLNQNNYNHNYVRSSAGETGGIITSVNSGTTRNVERAEMGLEMHELKGDENGKPASENQTLNRHIAMSRFKSKTGNHTFWWDKKDVTDCDTESMEEIMRNTEVPAGFENTPANGIMKSTIVTVSVEDSKLTGKAQRSRSERLPQNNMMDRGGSGLSLDLSEQLERGPKKDDLGGF